LLLDLSQQLDLVWVLEQVEKELPIFFLFDALSFPSIVVVHAINYLFEGDQLEGSGGFLIGLVDKEVEVVHEANLILPTEFLVEVYFRDEAKLILEENSFRELVTNGLMKDTIF
jgi:hypothetical protein